jgi:hypothetical protein
MPGKVYPTQFFSNRSKWEKAGRPSIRTGKYHGHLIEGKLVPQADSAT